MKLIVGLGNPGEKYKNTRHNVGFLVVDKLFEGIEWKVSKSTGALISWVEFNEEKVELVKPQKFMNKSGLTVKGIKKSHPKLKNENIYVIHDDLDIMLGEYKIDLGKGPKVHNGLASIYEQLGAKDFWHIRIGMDNRIKIGFKGTGEEYVLGNWLREEKKVINRVIKEIKEELNVLI